MLAPLEIAVIPEEIVPIVSAEDSVTVIALDGVKVNTLDGITMGFDESVTVPEDTFTVLLVKVTWTADDGITVGFDESVTVPEETAMALDKANDGAEDKVTVLAPAAVDSVVVTALDGVTVPDDTLTVLLVRVT